MNIKFNAATNYPNKKKIHHELKATQNLVYDVARFTYSPPLIDVENAKYGGCTFTLNDLHVRFRVAKITPKKTGQFVTLWQRIGKIPAPFDLSDSIDFFVISVRKEDFFGQFVFPKEVLREKGIISENGKGGKMAIRVYPPWDITISQQSQKTQKWQLKYFLEIPDDKPVDYYEFHRLYGFGSL